MIGKECIPEFDHTSPGTFSSMITMQLNVDDRTQLAEDVPDVLGGEVWCKVEDLYSTIGLGSPVPVVSTGAMPHIHLGTS